MRYPDLIISLLLVVIISNPAYAERVVIGATYPVTEHDALNVIKERSQQVNWPEKLKNVNPQAMLMKPFAQLPRVEKPRQFNYIPYYTLEQDITDATGNTLYPKGFRYNPLDYFFMPGRILVIGDKESDVDWLKQIRQTTDRIITTANNIQLLQTESNFTAFQFMDRMPERLGVQRVPSIIRQEQNYFVIEEVLLEQATP